MMHAVNTPSSSPCVLAYAADPSEDTFQPIDSLDGGERIACRNMASIRTYQTIFKLSCASPPNEHGL